MKVKLTYFKLTGKYYSSGSYITDKELTFEIFQEVRQKLESGTLPDLVEGAKEFIVLVKVPKHPYNVPALIISSEILDKIREK